MGQQNSVMSHLANLGLIGKDKVTGFKGVIDSVYFDLYGCVQYAMKPPMNKEGEVKTSLWFDAARIEVDTKTARVMDMPNFHEGYVAEGRKGPAEKHSRQG